MKKILVGGAEGFIRGNLDKPKGVRVRNSNNQKIISKIGWQPKIKLEIELNKT